MSLKFKLNIFEGPLDLLIHLIRKNEVDIQDIPISEITKQYLEYLELMKDLDLEIAGEFIVLASTLLRIKSKMLLPRPPVDDEENEDPRQELINMIIEYKKYKEAAEFLDVRRNTRELVFERGNTSIETEFVNTEATIVVDMLDLLKSFSMILKKQERLVPIEADTVKVEDRIEYIEKLLEEKDNIYFDDLFENKKTRKVLVATFLAVLELIRLQKILIIQRELFGKIEIIKKVERLED